MTKRETIDKLVQLGVEFEENLSYHELQTLLKQAQADKKPEVPEESSEKDKKPVQAPENFVKVSKEDWNSVQEQLKMLRAVADKGRIYNYENQRTEKKPFKVKLSIYKDQLIIGWRTLKDELIRDSRTGATIGETQQYEIKLLNREDKIQDILIDGYVSFSNARYAQRIDAEVVGTKESWDGEQTFDLRLPDGRVISLNSRFVN